MMADRNEQVVEKAALPFGKWTFAVLAAAAAIALISFKIPSFMAARIPAAYILLAVLFVEIYLIYEFARRGGRSAPLLPLLAGWAFALGGIGLDVVMTAIKTPDFSNEDNPVVRAFLDSGYSVEFIRAFGFVAQSGLAVLACLAWAAFLRHRITVLTLARALAPGSYREFVNAAVRGVLRPPPLISRRGITWPRFNWYRITCFALAGLVGANLYRWYCGLEWLGVVPPRQPIITLITACAGVIYFYLWLWQEYRKRLPPGRVGSEVDEEVIQNPRA